MNKKKNQIEKVDELTPNKVLDIFIPILGAVFIAVSAIFYVLSRAGVQKCTSRSGRTTRTAEFNNETKPAERSAGLYLTVIG